MKYVLGFLISLFGFSALAEVDCQRPSPYQCEFYKSCVETAKPCGVSGYALGFGERNCKKFLAFESRLSEQGRLFSIFTRTCLQRKLAETLSPSLSCKALRDEALNSHVGCYTDHMYSICNLSPVDLSKLLWQFDVFDTFQPSSLKQMYEVSRICISRLTDPARRAEWLKNATRVQITKEELGF